MGYELDISSETDKVADDLENNQAMLVVDSENNSAKIIVKDDDGDAFDANFMPPPMAFVADPVGVTTDEDVEARATIIEIRDALVAAGLMEAEEE